jgi:hypothetical protein
MRRKKLTSKQMSEIGRAGGLATLKKRGSKFFARISKRRKTFAGGRPRKDGKKKAE